MGSNNGGNKVIEELKDLFDEILDKYSNSERSLNFELGYISLDARVKYEIQEYRNKWDKIIEEMKEATK